jgi:hypothetical protein
VQSPKFKFQYFKKKKMVSPGENSKFGVELRLEDCIFTSLKHCRMISIILCPISNSYFLTGSKELKEIQKTLKKCFFCLLGYEV